MANPQSTDAHLRVAHSILETIKQGNLRRSTAQRIKTLPELLDEGLMPQVLPCISPCSRSGACGPNYLFACESCAISRPNPYYYSIYKKARITNFLRWAVWERDNFTCQRCHRRRYLTIDHIIPESTGGKPELNNLQTLCKSCNSRKSTKVKGNND